MISGASLFVSPYYQPAVMSETQQTLEESFPPPMQQESQPPGELPGDYYDEVDDLPKLHSLDQVEPQEEDALELDQGENWLRLIRTKDCCTDATQDSPQRRVRKAPQKRKKQPESLSCVFDASQDPVDSQGLFDAEAGQVHGDDDDSIDAMNEEDEEHREETAALLGAEEGALTSDRTRIHASILSLGGLGRIEAPTPELFLCLDVVNNMLFVKDWRYSTTDTASSSDRKIEISVVRNGKGGSLFLSQSQHQLARRQLTQLQPSDKICIRAVGAPPLILVYRCETAIRTTTQLSAPVVFTQEENETQEGFAETQDTSLFRAHIQEIDDEKEEGSLSQEPLRQTRLDQGAQELSAREAARKGTSRVVSVCLHMLCVLSH